MRNTNNYDRMKEEQAANELHPNLNARKQQQKVSMTIFGFSKWKINTFDVHCNLKHAHTWRFSALIS